MSIPAPKKIEKTSPHELTFTWGDGATCTLTLKFLREECPCASCKGEVILGKVYKPMTLPTYTEGMYELTAIETVGNYAMQVSWKDGHSTGIYTWEYLKLLCRAGNPPKEN